MCSISATASQDFNINCLSHAERIPFLTENTAIEKQVKNFMTNFKSTIIDHIFTSSMNNVSSYISFKELFFSDLKLVSTLIKTKPTS